MNILVEPQLVEIEIIYTHYNDFFLYFVNQNKDEIGCCYTSCIDKCTKFATKISKKKGMLTQDIELEDGYYLFYQLSGNKKYTKSNVYNYDG